jgi:hypothetical protein
MSFGTHMYSFAFGNIVRNRIAGHGEAQVSVVALTYTTNSS